MLWHLDTLGRGHGDICAFADADTYTNRTAEYLSHMTVRDRLKEGKDEMVMNPGPGVTITL